MPRLRRICTALPEVEERVSHGEPAWFIRGKKMFVTYANHHHDDRVAFWCSAANGMQDTLVRADPTRFFVPPYVGTKGWVGLYMDVGIDWEEVEETVLEAYLNVAPARLAAQVESTM